MTIPLRQSSTGSLFDLRFATMLANRWSMGIRDHNGKFISRPEYFTAIPNPDHPGFWIASNKFDPYLERCASI